VAFVAPKVAAGLDFRDVAGVGGKYGAPAETTGPTSVFAFKVALGFS
jgi:hypothetical protein